MKIPCKAVISFKNSRTWWKKAVLAEFEALDRRGGVLGAMETMYQRSKIQEESMYYEGQKASGELPIIGVNTYLNPESEGQMGDTELIRSTEEEKKESQIQPLNAPMRSTKPNRDWRSSNLNSRPKKGITCLQSYWRPLKLARSDKPY